MYESTNDSTSDVKRLEHCIGDLVSLIALPAIWRGGDPTRIAQILIDALLRMVDLDFVHVWLNEPAQSVPRSILRVSESYASHALPEEISRVLVDWHESDCRASPAGLLARLDKERMSVYFVPLGAQGEIGSIIAASERPGFPAQTEELLLRVAANQASFALHEAQLLSAQKRLAAELEERVAERTARLAAANEELRKEIAERKVIEQRLTQSEVKLQIAFDEIQQSEARLRHVIDAIPTLTWCNRPDGPNEFLSKRWHEYTGLTPEQSHGWGWHAAFHPDDLPPLMAAWRALMISGEPGEREARLRRHDGVYRWFLIRTAPFRDETGRIVRWYGTSTDIEDRKQAEDALKASEREFELIANSIPALVWSARRDGACEFFNRNYLTYVGLPLEQLQGSGWTNVVHPDDLDGLVRAWRSRMAGDERAEAEARLRRFDGAYRWFLFRAEPVLDESGAVAKWYGTNTDIDDQKRAAERLRRSEAFLEEGQILGRIGNFSWVIATGEIRWSEQLYRIFEFDSGAPVTIDLIGARVHPDDRPLIYDMVGKARRGEDKFEYAHRLLMPDGTIKHLHLIAHATRDRDAQLEYIGAVQDVTQRRLSEEALSRAQAELTKVARMTSLGVLTASIAHEVNQPLSGIITNASTCLRMLSATPPNVEGARETAHRTIRDGNRAADVAKRLRTLYMRKESQFESMDLNQAAREVLSILQSEAQRHGVIVRHELANDVPPVMGDRIQLQQVILNLLRNSFDAVSTVDGRPRNVLVKTERAQDRRACLSIKDNGVGFQPQAADKLFHAFHTTKSDGMGLGLSISRSIVEAHHGRLWAQANDGPGATFTFVLPCIEEGGAGAKARNAPEDEAPGEA